MTWRDELPSITDDFLQHHEGELIGFRRHLHAYPELSQQEFATTDALLQRLRAAGLQPQRLESGTGLICDIAQVGDPAQASSAALGDGEGPTVALRADIDALAMPDESPAAHRSQTPGVAHACGHDAHAAIVLGAGLLLSTLVRRPGFPAGRVRLVFEPSEEQLPGGAVQIVQDGYLKGVDAIYGLHCDPKLDAGQIGISDGPITSASDRIEILLRGPGGHTARPEDTVDLVSVAGRLASRLPARVIALSAEYGPAKMVFGSIHAGDAPNVIPASAVLGGTMRTPSREVWLRAPEIIESAVTELLEPTGAEFELTYGRGVPPVINDDDAAELVARVGRSVLGEDATLPTYQSWGGDSFAWFLEQTPGAYTRLGVHDPSSSAPRLDLHSSTFDLDEDAIAVGVRLLVAVALEQLEQSGQFAA